MTTHSRPAAAHLIGLVEADIADLQGDRHPTAALAQLARSTKLVELVARIAMDCGFPDRDNVLPILREGSEETFAFLCDHLDDLVLARYGSVPPSFFPVEGSRLLGPLRKTEISELRDALRTHTQAIRSVVERVRDDETAPPGTSSVAVAIEGVTAELASLAAAV